MKRIHVLIAVAVVLVFAPAWTAAARPGASDLSAAVAEASTAFGLPRAWIERVIAAESGGDPMAVSPVGARGLMQLMPGTWEDLQARLGLGSDPFDARDNVMAGAAYLREMFDRFGAAGFLAAYHAGPARYARYLAGAGALGPATRAYVARVGRTLAAEGPGRRAASRWLASPLFPAPAAAGDDGAAIRDPAFPH